jgi:hypothetical protein
MSYIGLNPEQQLLNTSTEFFSGDASTVEFFLSRSVASASDLDVMVGNVAQRPFVDYVAQNLTMQFTSAPASGTNNITVTFRAGALNSLDLTANAFGAGTVGQPAVYSVAANNTGIYWPNATTMNVTVAGSSRVQFTSNVESTSNTTGALTVSGGAGITGNINTSGLVAITNTFNSANINSGALTVSGGAGIVGNLNIGGDITCVGDFTVNGTFTTTGTDALVVEDPFVFLANANPGDSFDTGVVSQYDDAGTTRYTGYFRDITDGKYKLFGNLTTKPTTVVDSGNASFELNQLVVSQLTATGNVTGAYFVGNGSALTGISSDVTKIFNSDSLVEIPTPNGNIDSNVNGLTISVVSSAGLAVTGLITATANISAAGNVLAGNLSTAGLVTATGNIVSAANISGGNLLTGGGITATANITGGNLTTAGQTSSGGNVTGGNLKTTGLISATGDVFGDNFSATTAVNAAGNITGGNLISSGIIDATGEITSSGGGLSVVGNIVGGNVNTGNLSLSGNVITAINSTSNVTTTANIAGGNIVSTALLQGATLNASGAVTFSGTATDIAVGTSQTTGIITLGGASQTGTINIGRSTGTQSLILANGAVASGDLKTVSVGEGGADGSTTTIAVGPVTGAGTGTVTFNTGTTVIIASTSGSALSVAGNVTGGNLKTSGITIGASAVTGVSTLSATANITGGNLLTAGVITATGNITGGNIATAGLVTATGNVTGGNILTTGLISVGGTVSATGNVTGGNINTAGLVTATGNITSTANIAAGNISTANLITGGTVSATANVIGANIQGGTLSLSGDVISGLNMTTQIVSTANVTGGNINTAGLSAASRFVSSVTTGTAPLTVASTTVVSNLNADLLDGQQGSYYQNASNMNAGSLPSARLTGSYAISISGLAGTATALATARAINGVNFNGTSAITVEPYVEDDESTNATRYITFVDDSTAGYKRLNEDSTLTYNPSSGTLSATIFSGVATTARYADLAEMYCADHSYEPGTVLSFGGDQEITISNTAGDTRVAGVVSTNPAHLMNSTLECTHAVALALTGRVPAHVTGTIRKGDMMISAPGGRAQACATPAMGTVIGKALEDFDGETGTIEIVVGRM